MVIVLYSINIIPAMMDYIFQGSPHNTLCLHSTSFCLRTKGVDQLYGTSEYHCFVSHDKHICIHILTSLALYFACDILLMWILSYGKLCNIVFKELISKLLHCL